MAISMLDKKSSIYSDRPVIGMGGELVGWKNTMIFMSYGTRFRNGRRLAHQLFGNSVNIKQFSADDREGDSSFFEEDFYWT